MRDEDIEAIYRMSGLAPHMPFSAKIHAIIQRLDRGEDWDGFRKVMRQELERVAGGMN